MGTVWEWIWEPSAGKHYFAIKSSLFGVPMLACLRGSRLESSTELTPAREETDLPNFAASKGEWMRLREWITTI